MYLNRYFLVIQLVISIKGFDFCLFVAFFFSFFKAISLTEINLALGELPSSF